MCSARAAADLDIMYVRLPVIQVFSLLNYCLDLPCLRLSLIGIQLFLTTPSIFLLVICELHPSLYLSCDYLADMSLIV